MQIWFFSKNLKFSEKSWTLNIGICEFIFDKKFKTYVFFETKIFALVEHQFQIQNGLTFFA